ncbi:MAG TPA: FkbM family methyltransferase [Planctomycetaceae bacterium]|nr:FkbM family methyltransferase [Planctomycetaceae bacterium]
MLRPGPNVVDFYYRYTPFKRRRPALTPLGFKMAGGNSVHHRGMMAGQFESAELACVLALVDKSDVFVDVGANIGYYACLARQRNKHVISVEPQPANLRFLCANLVANGWHDAEVYPMGLGKKPGIAVLYGLSSTGASLLPGWAGAPMRWRQTIPITTLDTIIGGRFGDKRMLIKIDVEGVEFDVLQGAVATLARAQKPTFIVEICLNENAPTGPNPHFQDTFRLFWQNGYRSWLLDEPRHAVTCDDVDRWIEQGRTDANVINFLFTPAPGDGKRAAA